MLLVRCLAFLALGGTLGAQATPAQSTVRVQLTTNGHDKWYEELPVPHRTADRAFWLSTAASFVLTVADSENSIHALGNCRNAHEENPVFGACPGRGRYYGIMLPLAGLEAYFSYRYKRESDALRGAGIPDHKWRKWWIPSTLNGGAHLVGIVTTLASTGK